MLLIGLTTVLIAVISDANVQNAKYECGEHGRFEYCIDGISGCVIGCYCHPGYYFDTESKICEVNTKLTMNLRRNYNVETITTSPRLTTTKRRPKTTKPITTTESRSEVLDKKVDTITNNVDDLSDWLYNHFFKAVENQVINKSDSVEIINRRAERDSNKKKKHKPLVQKKTSKKRRKKAKLKKKRKLLRITEDDSLFDSTSESESEEPWSDSTSSDEDSSSSESSSEEKKIDKSHGHRKIIMIQKKPKTPLPSFVFMPDAGTQYFPPIEVGMPPMPQMPMFPMGPPMMPPPLFPPPFIVLPPENNSNGSEKPDDKSTAAATTATSSIRPTNDDVTTDEASTVADGTETTAGGEVTEVTEVTENLTATSVAIDATNPPSETKLRDLSLRPRGGHKKKAAKTKKLRTKPNKASEKNQLHFISDETPSNKDTMMYDAFRKSVGGTVETTEASIDSVDVQYLADLIHGINANKRSESNYNKQYSPNYNEKNDNILDKMVVKSDDNFYSKLGKDIALLVHKMDSNGQVDQEVDIEIQPWVENMQAVANQNSNSPHSYWERFARSPTSPHVPRLKEKWPSSFPVSNEELNNLENIVERTASSGSKLTLAELESIIRSMAKIEVKDVAKNYTGNNLVKKNILKLNIIPNRTHLKPTTVKNMFKNKKYDIIKNTSRESRANNFNNRIKMHNNFRYVGNDYSKDRIINENLNNNQAHELSFPTNPYNHTPNFNRDYPIGKKYKNLGINIVQRPNYNNNVPTVLENYNAYDRFPIHNNYDLESYGQPVKDKYRDMKYFTNVGDFGGNLDGAPTVIRPLYFENEFNTMFST